MGVNDADDDEEEDAESIQLIDDEGNLFGVVNVIDALVVLGVIAVVVAGVALVTGGGGTDSGTDDATNQTAGELDHDTRYITVAFGLQRNAFIDRLLTGNTLEVNGVNATVSDAYLYPTVNPNDPRSGLTLRLAVNSTITDSQFGEQVRVGDNRIRVGDELEFTADGRTVTGSPTAIDDSGTELQVERLTTEVTIENVDPRMAYRIESGQTETNLRGEEIATIQSVSVSSVDSDADTDTDSQAEQTYDLTLEVELLTLETDAGYQFRGSTLREGNDIAFDLGSRVVRGTVSSL